MRYCLQERQLVGETIAEAGWLEAQRIDAIVPLGTEAGGHRGTFTTEVDSNIQPGLFPLPPKIADAAKVLIIAAAGIADALNTAAAFARNASSVQIGTAFLHYEEANVPDIHHAALTEVDNASTVVTDVLTGKTARFIRNMLIDDLVASGARPLRFPLQLGATEPLRHAGTPNVAVLLSGQSAALPRDGTPGDLVELPVAETERHLLKFA